MNGFKSREMVHLTKLIEKIAATDAAVLILGETGVGKEFFADPSIAQARGGTRPSLRWTARRFRKT